MAVTMVLVPTNPEVFGVLLYSFWWMTLWPLIVLGWKRDSGSFVRFFLPFIGFAWVLLAHWQRLDIDRLRTASVVLLCLSLLGLATTFSRNLEERSSRLSWKTEVRKCAARPLRWHRSRSTSTDPPSCSGPLI
jgi:hypothetical protein